MNKYAVIGNPVEHSLSPLIFQLFKEQTNQSFNYLKIKAPLDGCAAIIKQFQHEGGKGVNITLPFKREAYQLSDRRSRETDETHTASALKFQDNGIIYAVNYDGFGLLQDIIHNHNITLTQKSILIIGAGGATCGILGHLINTMPAKIVIVNRTISKALELKKIFHLRTKIEGVGFKELKSVQYDIIINATSLGHQGKSPPLPNGLISPQTFCYDLSYGKIASPFLEWAKYQGAKYNVDGSGMLVEHNAAVFYLWFGIYPNTSPVIKILRSCL